jgi:hypothetical protein
MQTLPATVSQSYDEFQETVEAAEQWTRAHAPNIPFSRPLRDNPVFLRFLRGQEFDWSQKPSDNGKISLRQLAQETPLTARDAAEGLAAGFLWRRRGKSQARLAAPHWPLALFVAFGWMAPIHLALSLLPPGKSPYGEEFLILTYFGILILIWEHLRFRGKFTVRERDALTRAFHQVPAAHTSEAVLRFAIGSINAFLFIALCISIILPMCYESLKFAIFNGQDIKLFIIMIIMWLIIIFYYIINRSAQVVQVMGTVGMGIAFKNPFVVLEKALQDWLNEPAKKDA